MKSTSFINLATVFYLILAVCIAHSQVDSGFVWFLKGEQNTVYLAGSLHLLSEENYPLPAVFESAYNEAEVIVLEMHPDSAQTTDAQNQLVKAARYSPGEDLTSNLQDTLLDRLHALCNRLSLDPHQFYSYKPWFVAVNLTLVQLRELGYDTQIGVDRYFFSRANADGKDVLGLESFKYQMQLFAGLSDAEQGDLLNQAITQMITIRDEIENIIWAWYKVDLKSLEKILIRSFYDYPHLAEKFLTQRNENWIQHILSYLKQKDDFMVIVGSGHFPGKYGLLQLFDKYGLKPAKLTVISDQINKRE